MRILKSVILGENDGKIKNGSRNLEPFSLLYNFQRFGFWYVYVIHNTIKIGSMYVGPPF